jgi:acetyltransferase-like isoleucine patch superfamily enzyme
MKLFKKNFYLIGSGGYGKQVSFLLKKNKIISSNNFVDDRLKFKITDLIKINKKIYYNITIGNTSIREKIYEKIKKKNLIYLSLIFPNKNIYSKKINKGCIIEPNTFIANDVKIGIGCFVLYGVSIGHNSLLDNFCNIGCNVVISGNVNIGKKVAIGANSFISNNINICKNVTLTPGSVVLRDIKKPGIYKDNIQLS